MPLSVGARIGPYEITGALGAGGMGEVYKARDTSLGRDVAIKVLPAAVANDSERLARFSREAKLLASLSHANIAQVYGLELPSTGSGQVALVMELVPGQDLTAHLTRGAMSLHDALPIAIQIAFALEAAHERGIIHRDLKPANIKVTDDGAVKVLDFGLAKAMDPNGSNESAEAMNSPTLTAHATAAGIILGTAAYMSPEQARGRDADKRADVWAFGVVLFEMLAGTRLFHGETISDTLAAVLRQDIPWSALPAGTHPEVVRLLRRCLERDRKNRLHDIADARIVLDDVVRGGGKDDVVAAPVAAARRAWWPIAVGAIVLAVLGFASGRLTLRERVAADAKTMRLVIPTPPGVTDMGEPAVAADGSFVVFVGGNGKGRQLYLHRLDEIAARPIARTEGATIPAVSPDGRWIAYQRANRLEKIAVEGGDPIPLAELTRTGGPSMVWLPKGLVFPQSWLGGLSTLADDGSAVRTASTLDTARGEIGHWFPTALPDGRHVLMSVWSKGTGLNDAEIAILDLDTGKHTILFKGIEARYLAPGFIVFFRAGAFHAIRFDAKTRTVTGEAVRVLDDAFGNVPEVDTTQAALGSGTFAYVSGPAVVPRELLWVADGGKVEALPFAARPYLEASVNADGKRIAVTVLEAGRYVLRILHVDRKKEDVLDLPGSSWGPVWHPNGRQLAFNTMRKGEFDIYMLDVTAQAKPEPLLLSEFDDTVSSFLADGSSVIVRQSQTDGLYLQKLMRLNPIGTPETLIPFSADHASISGDFVLFESERSGTSEIYVQPVKGGATAEQISSAGGTSAIWSPSGREILYLREPEIIAVPFTVEGGRLRAGTERVWARVEGSYNTSVLVAAPDGRVLVEVDRTSTPREMRVIVNWQSEVGGKLRR